MKFFLEQTKDDVIRLRPESFPTFGGEDILGQIELDVKPEKRWVTKEADCYQDSPWNGTHYWFRVPPTNVRNIKITYEVEE